MRESTSNPVATSASMRKPSPLISPRLRPKRRRNALRHPAAGIQIRMGLHRALQDGNWSPVFLPIAGEDGDGPGQVFPYVPRASPTTADAPPQERWATGRPVEPLTCLQCTIHTDPPDARAAKESAAGRPPPPPRQGQWRRGGPMATERPDANIPGSRGCRAVLRPARERARPRISIHEEIPLRRASLEPQVVPPPGGYLCPEENVGEDEWRAIPGP